MEVWPVKGFPKLIICTQYTLQSLKYMEVEYTGGDVFSPIFFLYINVTTLGACVEPRQLDTSDLIGCCFDGPPIACKQGLRVTS